MAHYRKWPNYSQVSVVRDHRYSTKYTLELNEGIAEQKHTEIERAHLRWQSCDVHRSINFSTIRIINRTLTVNQFENSTVHLGEKTVKSNTSPYRTTCLR